jgi:two-component system response regulator DesR
VALLARGGTLADVIRRVHAGSRYVDPALAADALTAPECPLTPRELEVLRLAEYDTPVAAIARRTHLSGGTVRNYLAAAVSRLGVTGRAEAFLVKASGGASIWVTPATRGCGR